VGWYRDGFKICYYQNNLKRKNAGFYHTLNFSLKFPYDNDTVYIAHCYPYTYSQLQRYLGTLEADPTLRNRVQRKTLCQTIAGNNCDYVIIGDFTNGKEKKGIFLTSRVHPGETMASYLIEYIIDYLVSNSPIARTLRENFIIKIVPMLNIDGVVNGNYRCNLAGVDLNRQWIDPSKKSHPTIYHTKQLIKRMKEERDLMLYCDFHGHSRKKNAFIYGCARDTSRKEQIFPGLMKNNCKVFSFKDCGFMLQKDREGAARVNTYLI
jgi:murein tripeptide amidase MpaA